MFFLIEKAPNNNELAYILRPDSHADFTPHLWTGDEITYRTAGWAYALNCPEIGRSMPGDLITNKETDNDRPTSTNFNNVMSYDGLFALERQHLPDTNEHAVAIRYGRDPVTHRLEYIALRRDSNGLWSFMRHQKKMGCRRALKPRQTDFQNALIHDPETADFGQLSAFGGYAAIPYAGIPFRRNYPMHRTHKRPTHPILTTR